jgi:primary-amine oxidase
MGTLIVHADTGDLPNTVFTTAHAGLTMMPLNYYTHDISTETLSQVQINFKKNGNVSKVQTFGQQEAVCSVNLAKEAPDLYSLTDDYY